MSALTLLATIVLGMWILGGIVGFAAFTFIFVSIWRRMF